MTEITEKVRAVILDLDGTILDSIPGVILANQRAAADCKLDVPPAKTIRSLLARGMVYREIVRCLWPHATDAERLALQEKAFAETRAMQFQEVRGARTALSSLRKLNVALALHTNRMRDENLSHDLLAAGFREEDFSVIHTPDNRIPPKPNQQSLLSLIDRLSRAGYVRSAEHACVASDSVPDAEMTIACGCRFIGVLTGAATRADFEPFLGRGITIVDSIADVPGALERW